MLKLKERYVVDDQGKRISVVLDIADYQELLDELDELEAIRAYDAAKASGDRAVPLSRQSQRSNRIVSELHRYNSPGWTSAGGLPQRLKNWWRLSGSEPRSGLQIGQNLISDTPYGRNHLTAVALIRFVQVVGITRSNREVCKSLAVQLQDLQVWHHLHASR